MSKDVFLTGLRANNDLHIGNYVGALEPIIDVANNRSGEFQINLFVPDLHSFTTPIDHSKLFEQILHNVRVFVAAGLDITNPTVNIYRQSYIPAHSELTWILDCFTGMGEMSRMTQFKDKTQKAGVDRVSVGLFNYPVLMAADILLYDAKYVPVGDDQSQHLEFARDIAERMNAKFGQLFVVPEAVKKQHSFFGKSQGLRIKDLVDPTKKMSKSDESGKGVIFLSDTPDVAAKKIMSATTDSVGKISYNHQEQPGISNLLDLLELLGGETQQFIGQTQYGPLKFEVAVRVSEFLKSFNGKLQQIDDKTILHKLEQSEAAMNKVAQQKLLTVQQAVGLRSR